MWNAANHRFIVPASGVYSVNATVQLLVENSPQQWITSIMKNGINYSNTDYAVWRGMSAGDLIVNKAIDLVICNANDYLQINVHNFGGNACATSNTGSPAQSNHFSITGPF